jgi:hypothetical protein
MMVLASSCSEMTPFSWVGIVVISLIGAWAIWRLR